MIPKKALDKNINKAEFTNKLVAEIKNRAELEREHLIQTEIVKRLGNIGIYLTTPEDIREFFKERLAITEIDGVNYIFLDYINTLERGTLLISYKA